jgi:hypothetical protein
VAAVEESVDGGHARLAAGIDGGEVENLHAGQLVDQALGVEPGLLAPDRPEVRAGARIAPVEEALQLLQLRGGLLHRQRLSNAARLPDVDGYAGMCSVSGTPGEKCLKSTLAVRLSVGLKPQPGVV